MGSWVGVCMHTKKGREHVCALFVSLSQPLVTDLNSILQEQVSSLITDGT